MIYTIYAFLYLVGVLVGLWTIFKKAGIPGWKALIPIYNVVVWIKVAGKDWKWYIYFLIPAINVFTFLLLVVETSKVFKRFGLLEQTFAVLFPWIYLPYLGLVKKNEYTDPKSLVIPKLSSAREWADAIIFALVAAVIIRGNIFEFYNIPSSSMEKSLLIGDYLMVSKMSYGARSAMTPLSMPLVHNVLPLTNGKVESYLKTIKMPYHRFPGLTKVKRFDAVVFNYPDGDTVSTAFQSNRSYHDLVREFGWKRVNSDTDNFGKIKARPVDKKENFIKRCVGLPGETLQIIGRRVFINGKPIEDPHDLQFTYAVRLKENETFGVDPMRFFSNYGISMEDIQSSVYYSYLFVNDSIYNELKAFGKTLEITPLVSENPDEGEDFWVRIAPCFYGCISDQEYNTRNSEIQTSLMLLAERLKNKGFSELDLAKMNGYFTLPLTHKMYELLLKSEDVEQIIPIEAKAGFSGKELFPHDEYHQASVDNFGPVVIPAKGMTIPLNEKNVATYRRAIVNFEHNTLEVRDGKIFINGNPASEYTFKMDYYWMQGDNRHNSADSRYWGFVPEDHIVGKATMIVFSKDKENNKIRWNRVFRNASKITE